MTGIAAVLLFFTAGRIRDHSAPESPWRAGASPDPRRSWSSAAIPTGPCLRRNLPATIRISRSGIPGSWEARNDWKPFVAAGIARARVHMDDRATDTVTNFTTLVADFQRRGLRHLYLVTSDFHMRRAKWIADIVLGSRGHRGHAPSAFPSDRPPESLPHALRDVARSFLWLATGHTGAFLNGQLLKWAGHGPGPARQR